MDIEVLRIGQRIVRDDRATTHVALVSRAFGASRIYMSEVNPEIQETVRRVNLSWGGGFEVEIIDSWKEILRRAGSESKKIVHLSMYGEPINDIGQKLAEEQSVLIVVGAEKVPREIYDYADYNVSVGSQPHSEIAALAVVMDRMQRGCQFGREFPGARMRILPSRRGKSVVSGDGMS